jgi:hypothetical protein
MENEATKRPTVADLYEERARRVRKEEALARRKTKTQTDAELQLKDR